MKHSVMQIFTNAWHMKGKTNFHWKKKSRVGHNSRTSISTHVNVCICIAPHSPGRFEGDGLNVANQSTSTLILTSQLRCILWYQHEAFYLFQFLQESERIDICMH
eukprot:101415_1